MDRSLGPRLSLCSRCWPFISHQKPMQLEKDPLFAPPEACSTSSYNINTRTVNGFSIPATPTLCSDIFMTRLSKQQDPELNFLPKVSGSSSFNQSYHLLLPKHKLSSNGKCKSANTSTRLVYFTIIIISLSTVVLKRRSTVIIYSYKCNKSNN